MTCSCFWNSRMKEKQSNQRTKSCLMAKLVDIILSKVQRLWNNPIRSGHMNQLSVSKNILLSDSLSWSYCSFKFLFLCSVFNPFYVLTLWLVIYLPFLGITLLILKSFLWIQIIIYNIIIKMETLQWAWSHASMCVIVSACVFLFATQYLCMKWHKHRVLWYPSCEWMHLQYKKQKCHQWTTNFVNNMYNMFNYITPRTVWIVVAVVAGKWQGTLNQRNGNVFQIWTGKMNQIKESYLAVNYFS